MSVDLKSLRTLLLTGSGVALVAAYPVLRFGSPEVIGAALAGALLSTGNAVLGFLAIEFAFGKSSMMFLKIVLGGMGIRMMLMLGIMLALILVWDVPAVALTVAVLAFYAVYLGFEVLHLHRKVSVKHRE